jgi:hypothetical protein
MTVKVIGNKTYSEFRRTMLLKLVTFSVRTGLLACKKEQPTTMYIKQTIQ